MCGSCAGFGGVSNVDRDGNNILQIKAIGVVISTFETLPVPAFEEVGAVCDAPVGRFTNRPTF